MDNDIVERLDVLHVWPQSIADHYADILTPRQAKELYAVGAVATDAKATIETLTADLARVTAERDAQEKRAHDHWRTINDQRYMLDAVVSMLGPIGRQVWNGWQAKNMLRVHYSWGPESAKLTGEERAAVMLEWDEAVANGKAEEIIDVDEYIAALGEKP